MSRIIIYYLFIYYIKKGRRNHLLVKYFAFTFLYLYFQLSFIQIFLPLSSFFFSWLYNIWSLSRFNTPITPSLSKFSERAIRVFIPASKSKKRTCKVGIWSSRRGDKRASKLARERMPPRHNDARAILITTRLDAVWRVFLISLILKGETWPAGYPGRAARAASV